MANTYTHIASTTLTSSSASISFTSISTSYTDLVIYFGGRTTGNHGQASRFFSVKVNNTSGATVQEQSGYGASNTDARFIDNQQMIMNIGGGGTSMPTGYFTVAKMFIPNYNSSNKKVFVSQGGNNDDVTASDFLIGYYGGTGLNGGTGAITQVDVLCTDQNLASGSFASLYGIKNS